MSKKTAIKGWLFFCALTDSHGDHTRALSIHSIDVRQMQMPRKYADIASHTNRVTEALYGWFMTSRKLQKNQTAVTAMFSGMKRRTRNGCRNFMRVTVSSARQITVMKVSHGAGERM
jgi:hypothetical protein